MESEEKSRRAEAQLRLLFEATHQGVLQLRPDGRIVSMNPAAEHIFGLSAADLQGQSPRSTRLRAIREDGTAFPAGTHPFELAVDNGHEVRGTVMGIYNAAQDEYRWIQVDAVPLFRPQSPKPYAVYEFFDDITSRKRAEDALRENDAQLRLALGAAGVGTFEINPQTGKMLCSEITRNQLGIGKDVEIDTDRFLAALHPEDRERIRQTWLELASPSTTASLEAEFRTIAADDRSQRWIAARARVIAGAGGQQVRIVGATLDISDRKCLEERLLQDGGQALTALDVADAEAALRESEERFRDTANSAPVIMWYGDSQKQVSFFNKQAAVFTGLSADQLLGDGWQQVIHPDDRETTCAAYSKSGDRRAAYQIEFRARRTDGEYRYMLGTTQPRYIGGVYAGQLGTVLDITELKRRQDEHLARQKLESLGTLAGGIAHDFNNLLGGILSQTELALAELDEGASAESEMKNIRAVAIRGAEIVRQLMVYAGQEADTTQLVDFSLLVEQTLELLKVVVSKHAVLRTILGSDVPPVRANPATLRQILINLVTNASEAMGERDGTIQVTTARVTVSSDPTSPTGTLPPGEYLQLEVSDTGCGMTPETQAKIFDPFFTTKSHGRGLGLPVVHGIVRRLGGEIFVTSHVRQGTTFRILLPAAVASPGVDLQPPATPITELRPAARGTILLVEDEESLRHAVSKILRRDGITVLEAPDGAAALEMLGNHEITVMLLDVTLPGMASPEVFREAKQLRPDVRVILTSAYGAERVAAMFAGFGPQPFLRKPYRAAEVLKFLAEPEG
jgi:PAS domain S-box-containing protein